VEDNASQDTPKRKSASTWITLGVIGVLVAAFVVFILFYPVKEKPVPGTGNEVANTGTAPEEETFNVLKVGTEAPDFSLTDTNGKQWTLSKLRGKAVLVNFWATWCPPCRQEMPSIGHLHELMAKNKDFQIVTILFRDRPEAAKAYFKSHDFGMPILLDPGTTVARTYGLTGVPETYIVDKKGILRKKDIGPPPGGFDTPEFLAFFGELASE
jgi:peroxiredoxin